MRKYDFISALAQETAKEVVRNRDEWMKYLTTAARLYKYPFREQLLIYAQRPDATACASIEIWNKRMHCWVNKGAKGIALIDEDDAHGKRLKYVFDVSDVHAARRIRRYPELWEVHEEHKDAVINRLEQTYGSTDEKRSFEEKLIEISRRIAADYYEELLPDLKYLTEGSFLDGLDEQNVGIRLRETLADSISFTLLSACGADMEEYKPELAFDFIHEFNSMDTLSVLGDAANELAKPVLLEIGRTVRAYNRNHVNEVEQNLSQKGLANTSEVDYNALKHESKGAQEESIDNQYHSVERGNDNESDLRTERGLSDSDITGGHPAGGSSNEIRDDEGELSEGEPQGRVLSVSSEGQTERASADHPETGRGADGTVDITDGGRRGSDRTAQSSRSDALGSEDEQHPEPGGGDREGRTDLPSVEDTPLQGEAPEPVFTQLSLFSSFEEQVGTVAAVEAGMKYTMPAAFSLPQEELDSIDTQAARDKLENGEADRQTEEMLLQVLTGEWESVTLPSQEENKPIPDKRNAVNFHISNDALGVGTPKEKFHRNVEAIKLLEQIEGEHRYATPQEQEILSQYVGWGGLADAFDESKTNWTAEYQELKNLLSPEEYRMARESTLNAHYTSPVIIRSMYDAIEKMRFTKGNILDPALGIGNFFGMVPDSMKESRLYGVELDGISNK